MSPSHSIVVLVALGLLSTRCTPAPDDGDMPTGVVDPVEGKCESSEPASVDPFADCVEAFEPAEGVSFGHDMMPAVVLGAPQGGGETTGGTHVASLGCGGSITLHFSEPWPIDRPGPDLVVFENAFFAGSTPFVEPAEVLVSDDGVQWHAFECTLTGDDPEGCAGRSPVAATGAGFDPALAGGDAFDLADVGLAEAQYVRLVDRTAEYYGDSVWCQGSAGGFDLDAVAVWEPSP